MIVNMIVYLNKNEKITPPGGFEPPTFRLTAERASRLRHGGIFLSKLINYFIDLLIRYNYKYLGILKRIKKIFNLYNII